MSDLQADTAPPALQSAGHFKVLTVGHSTRPLEEFVGLLLAHGVARLVDVRTLPHSRRNPQFNLETLPSSLAAAGIAYSHFPGLGGLKPRRPGSINTGWRNASFRAYADHMQTTGFANSLEEMIAIAQREQVALMCAEAVPWRCHRSLITDALLARGIAAEEIVSATHTEPHKLTPFARTEGTTITYPSPEPPTGQLF